MADSSSLNLIFFLICSSFMWTYTAARDTLKPGDTLNSTDFLVSAKGKFYLGFLLLEDESNSSSYLSISRNGSDNTAWVANKETPVSYPSGVLILDTKNTLKIMHQGMTDLDICSAPENTTNVVATLLDTGNFILQELSSVDGSTKCVLCQSFDTPTDTLLPGMKLGVNRSNGHIWSLTSWYTKYSKERGPFTLHWDPVGHELKIKRLGVVYWSSGAFRSGRFEYFSPLGSQSKLKYNFSIVSNDNEDYVTYTSVDPSSELLLTTTGILYEVASDVDVVRADYCKGSNTDGGCHRWSCTHIGDRSEEMSGYFTAANSNATISVDSDTSLNYKDCQANCWKDCECLACGSLFDNQTGCKYWIGSGGAWKFTKAYSTSNITFFYLTTKATDHSGNGINNWIWIGIGMGVASLLLIVLLCIICYRLRQRKVSLSGENETKIIENELLAFMKTDRPTGSKALQDDVKMPHDLCVFSYASVMAATCNFSERNKLGQGGFGLVYKGTLETGQEIAVKRLSKCSGQGVLEFKNELILIYELQHKNLVQLFGFCIHGEERMLIYEYMANKSLDYILFDSTRVLLLDWGRRFSIIEGIAQGLLYLHKYSRVRVIHRDLKASNILLDENMNPKISDFGMAKIFKHNEMEANTIRVVGTYGYMSPEYAMEGFFSIKSDVYSFGVLMLEIISGRKNNSFYNSDRLLNIVGYAWELWKEGTVLELMDPTLGESCVKDQWLRCAHVGLLCVEENAADRPTMSDVISMLTNDSMPSALPTKPAFFTGRTVVEASITGIESEIFSSNEYLSNSNNVPR